MEGVFECGVEEGGGGSGWEVKMGGGWCGNGAEKNRKTERGFGMALF